ncbi:MAG TPA: MBL fold metallo-hydrolase [Ktedonobacterales bacterium]|nr:MBL fold metallo-hydrolase [Ktedonobacterales bacterium]
MPKYICVTCGTQFPESASPPAGCPICQDDRQYVNPHGQQWTTLEAERGKHAISLEELAPGIMTIGAEPKLGIGERAYLIETSHGNVMWDLIAYFDQASVEAIQAKGGVSAIAISHPHFFTTMVDWSEALGGVPIYLHADHRPWVIRPDDAVHYWDGETHELLPDVTLIRCGGHFPGSTVLHWAAADDGAGALFTGDTIKVVADTRWATFMYSYPNTIPLDERTVRHIAQSVATRRFAHLYDGWTEMSGDARAGVQRSAERYIAHLRGES